jgi:two-component system chemotaxis sensor kinase CheA
MENVLTFEIEADELEIFLQDVNDHLDTMEAGILRLERAADPNTLNATFRAAHTLKAVAATVGHHQMAELTHTLETLFDAMREGQLSPTQTVIDALLTAVDALKALRDEVITGQPSDADVDALLARLHALMDRNAADKEEGKEVSEAQHRSCTTSTGSWLTPEQEAQVEDYRERGYTILEVEATTRADAFAQSARLLQATLGLAEMGHVIAQRPSLDNLTEGAHSGHLWLVLATQADKDGVVEILSQISDLAEYGVQSYGSIGALTAASPDTSTTTDTRVDTSASLSPAPLQSAVEMDIRGSDQTVRISTERLDALMNLVGELVTDRTRLIQVQDTLRVQYGKDGVIGALSDMATHLERVVDQLQQEVMQARMLPIEHLFRKFPRLVRDVARASGKQVNLVIEGEGTELDRSVIEVIGDPLIHLLRNAVDHGIEPPQERVAAGKPPAGTIWLTAAHEEGHIVITVKDNGRGIEPQRIRRAAVSRSLLSEEEAAQLDDDAAVNLIFQPNLSTAEQVTDRSGRGVGMDVVLTNIKRLSGSVTVESEVGRGTTFRVTLPLTLAIVEAMMVTLGDDVYAIPLAGIIESLYLSDVQISSVRGKPVLQWRDQVLPIVHLRDFFAHGRLAARPAIENKQAVVTVAWGRLKAGLVVDRLIGKQEVVIKSLGTFIGNVAGLSGCTILGDGRIALIVDVPGLISATMKKANTLSLAGY